MDQGRISCVRRRLIALRKTTPPDRNCCRTTIHPQEVALGQHAGRRGRARNAARPNQVQGITISHPERSSTPAAAPRKLEAGQAFFIQRGGYWRLGDAAYQRASCMLFARRKRGRRAVLSGSTRRHLSIPRIRLAWIKRWIQPRPLMADRSVKSASGRSADGVVLNCNTWGSLSSPDRASRTISFGNLDPEPESCMEGHAGGHSAGVVVLDELGLDAWFETSGGKGLH